MAAGTLQDVLKEGYWVYALVSPLWGKCYVEGRGYKRPRCPLERWIEHTRLAKLWSTKTSRSRFAFRRSPHYAAMAAVSCSNVVMVVLANPNPRELLQAEKYFTRRLQPVFNFRNVGGTCLNSATIAGTEDVVLAANRILRKNNPKLKPAQWAALITDAVSIGERSLAVKLARQARESNTKLSRLTALPQVLVSCAISKSLLGHMQRLLREVLHSIPGFSRTAQFSIQFAIGRVSWKRSPMLDSIVAPSFLKFSDSACRCAGFSATRFQGHVCTRNWETLPPCKGLSQLVGTRCLTYRLYAPLSYVLADIQSQVSNKLRMCGMPKDNADIAAERYCIAIRRPLEQYWDSLPPFLLLDNVKLALRAVRRSNMVFVRIDRNPGRMILMCQALWNQLQQQIFVSCQRYSPSMQPLSSETSSFAKETTDDFQSYVSSATGVFVPMRAPAGACRPKGYWTVKQKSLLESIPQTLKFRPIIAHHRHPCRAVLRRIGRALSLLVAEATKVVRHQRPDHLPVWKMHCGSLEWLNLLSRQRELTHLIEYDVEDCFLNTPRGLVVPALDFWLSFDFKRRRTARYFAISKDGKSEDFIGRPCSEHYWEISAAVVRAAVLWELDNNSPFEVVGANGQMLVLQQNKGLPIGGHLSAALVELVSLHRELVQPWPPLLRAATTMRYREIFFVALRLPALFPVADVADDLTKLLSMPVKTVRCDPSMRCLEMRITFAQESRVRCTLAFRTDNDRQGESGDVVSWPEVDDPRTKMLLSALLLGLAAKVRFYCCHSVVGLTATVRLMCRFVASKGYPRSWWVYQFGLALLRNGVPLPCLPRLMRKILSPIGVGPAVSCDV